MTGLALVAALCGWVGKSVLSISQRWATAVSELKQLGVDIHNVIEWKDREHVRLDTKVDRLDSRVERHEIWHDDHH